MKGKNESMNYVCPGEAERELMEQKRFIRITVASLMKVRSHLCILFYTHAL